MTTRLNTITARMEEQSRKMTFPNVTFQYLGVGREIRIFAGFLCLMKMQISFQNTTTICGVKNQFCTTVIFTSMNITMQNKVSLRCLCVSASLRLNFRATDPARTTLRPLRSLRLKFSRDQPRYFPTIGILLPLPNAFGLTLNTGAICALFHSLLFTIFSTRFTSAASNPISTSSFGPFLCSI